MVEFSGYFFPPFLLLYFYNFSNRRIFFVISWDIEI